MSHIHKEVAGRIVQRLVDAGMPTFPSHQFGMVDREKVLQLILNQLLAFDIKMPAQEWEKRKREGKPDVFTR